jgi:hypothetical protein
MQEVKNLKNLLNAKKAVTADSSDLKMVHFPKLPSSKARPSKLTGSSIKPLIHHPSQPVPPKSTIGVNTEPMDNEELVEKPFQFRIKMQDDQTRSLGHLLSTLSDPHTSPLQKIPTIRNDVAVFHQSLIIFPVVSWSSTVFDAENSSTLPLCYSLLGSLHNFSRTSFEKIGKLKCTSLEEQVRGDDDELSGLQEYMDTLLYTMSTLRILLGSSFLYQNLCQNLFDSEVLIQDSINLLDKQHVKGFMKNLSLLFTWTSSSLTSNLVKEEKLLDTFCEISNGLIHALHSLALYACKSGSSMLRYQFTTIIISS